MKGYKAVLRRFTACTLRTLALLPLATGSRITLALARLLRIADRLEEKEEMPEIREEGKELLIPSPVLYEAFRYLIEYGLRSREWIAVLGYQEIVGKKIVTCVNPVWCEKSSFAHAEVDYKDLADILRFYEKCGYEIAGLVHIHPWHGDSVHPSSTDMETHRKWEELYGGRFIGIVFNNSGVFRIFHAGRSVFRPVVVGEGVRRLGRDLYELERKYLP